MKRFFGLKVKKMSRRVKILISLFLKMFLGGIVGFILAIVLMFGRAEAHSMMIDAGAWYLEYGFYVYLVVSVFGILTLLYTFLKGKKLFLTVDEEGEYVSKDNHYLLSTSITYNILLVFSFANFGVLYRYSLEIKPVFVIPLVITFLVTLGAVTYTEFKLVRINQKKEPMLDTKSDPTSFKFQREYFSKLDEAQKLHVTTAAYKTSRVMYIVMFSAFVLAVVFNMIFENFHQSIIILGVLLLINLIVQQLHSFEK